MSVNDVIELVVAGNSEQSDMSLPQLEDDIPQTDYVNDLTGTLKPMEQVQTYKKIWLRHTKIIIQNNYNFFI